MSKLEVDIKPEKKGVGDQKLVGDCLFLFFHQQLYHNINKMQQTMRSNPQTKQQLKQDCPNHQI
jgi:hypothetical protein